MSIDSQSANTSASEECGKRLIEIMAIRRERRRLSGRLLYTSPHTNCPSSQPPITQAVAAGPGQDVELTLGTLLSFFGKYLIPSAGHPLPSPTGFSGTKSPSATEPLTLKV